jgi:thiamine biosynthesis lipoprotein
MSTWEPDSDISRYNRAPPGSWHAIPDAFQQVLACALEIAQASNGAYDPTIGALVTLWGFGAAGSPRKIPSATTLAAARETTGWKRLKLRQDGTELLQPGGLQLDFSAIAKGYGVDCIVRELQRMGVASALVEVGGDIRGYGHKPDGEPWRILIESPSNGADDDHSFCIVNLEKAALATSGDRWHAFEQNGKRFSHMIDPRNGVPIRHATSTVTVLAADAMRADAWATALLVMGSDEGFHYAERHHITARFIDQNYTRIEERTTPLLHTHLIT